jgi:hypothetical protein
MMKRTPVAVVISGLIWIACGAMSAPGQSLNIPAKTWGLSFGNSKEFTGLRFNFRDSRVRRISGINVTLWQPRRDNKDALVTGISIGTVPGGGRLRGVQLGLLGVAAERDIVGISLGLLGAGAGESITGINIGGLGIGAGENVKGLSLGGLGVGAGESLSGINIGGLGVGAGNNLKGFSFGGLGVGAGDNVKGITIGGLGAGAGKNMVGINIGGIGLGAGGRMTGINLAGIGAGAGEELKGLTMAGLAAGSVRVRGLVIAGGAVGGEDIKGAFLAGGCVFVPKGGKMSGLAVSPFNFVKGSQTGIAIGIVNYAWTVKGAQIGLVNIVRSNPRGLRILPVFNSSF